MGDSRRALPLEVVAPDVDAVTVGTVDRLYHEGSVTEAAAVELLGVLQARRQRFAPDTVQAFRDARAARIGGE